MYLVKYDLNRVDFLYTLFGLPHFFLTIIKTDITFTFIIRSHVIVNVREMNEHKKKLNKIAKMAAGKDTIFISIT